jgi:tellurite resistance protein TehA-like permease
MVQPDFNLASLETVPVFRATIKPAYQCRFFLTEDRTLVAWSFLFAMEYSTGAETSSKQLSFPLASVGGAGVLLPCNVVFAVLIFGSVCWFRSNNTWSKSEKELKACHSFPQPQPY